MGLVNPFTGATDEQLSPALAIPSTPCGQPRWPNRGGGAASGGGLFVWDRGKPGLAGINLSSGSRRSAAFSRTEKLGDDGR